MKRELVRKPKLLSKRELELQEVKYIYSLRAERDELQEQLNIAKKALEYIINSNDTSFGFINSNLRRYVEDALEVIGGNDE